MIRLCCPVSSNLITDLDLTLGTFATAHFAGVAAERNLTMSHAQYVVWASWVSFHRSSAESASAFIILNVWDWVVSPRPSTAMCVRLVQNIILS